MLDVIPARLILDWVDQPTAALWFDRIVQETAWEQPRIQMFGKRVAIPRLQAWYGDPEAHYRYSGLDNRPVAWTELLAEIRQRLETTTVERFNSVLVNRYRDGQDSNGWHSDDEKELGPEPCIASLSLGATRRFLLRRRDDKTRRIEVPLSSGSLLLMWGRSQADWQHCVPKQANIAETRINLTFRWTGR